MSTGSESAQQQLQPQLQPLQAKPTSDVVAKPEKLVEVTGALTLLGDSMNHGQVTVYSVLEAGGQTFTDMTVNAAVNSFLSTNLGNEVTLYIIKNEVVGIKTSDGRLFFTKACFAAKKILITGLLTLMFMIFLLVPVLGLILIAFSWYKKETWSNWFGGTAKTGKYLESIGGRAV